MLQLQRNAPPPPRRRLKPGDARKKYPVEKMTKVGDFFFVPNKQRDSIRTYFSVLGRQHGVKLRSEQIHARKTDTGWEPCPEDTPQAVSGVGVWRVE
jgi:hypothetical protein